MAELFFGALKQKIAIQINVTNEVIPIFFKFKLLDEELKDLYILKMYKKVKIIYKIPSKIFEGGLTPNSSKTRLINLFFPFFPKK